MALNKFLKSMGVGKKNWPEVIVVAIAGPTANGRGKPTNIHWWRPLDI